MTGSSRPASSASEDRVELLDGLLVAREPQGGRHATVVASRPRGARDGPSAAPLPRPRGERRSRSTSARSPSPSVVVVPGARRATTWPRIPPSPVLVVEVADTSLALDRLRKGGLYARAGIADYWVVNLVDEVLEVYRDPVAGPSKLVGWKYDSVRLLRRNSIVTPLAAPRARIRVEAMLP